MRRKSSTGIIILFFAALAAVFLGIGMMVVSCGSVSQPSIHARVRASITTDEEVYLTHLAKRNVYGDIALLAEGWRVCSDAGIPGITYEQVLEKSTERVGDRISVTVVDAAFTHLCREGGL